MGVNRGIIGLLAFFLVGALGSGWGITICEDGYICPCSSPILISLDGKAVRLTDAANGVVFDIAAIGRPVKIAWTEAGSRVAWLALDRNGNGKIDDGKELFGNFTPQPTCKSPNGFLALAEFDKLENGGNDNGLIDSGDHVYSSLRLWIDSNHNGISEPEELYGLASQGIESISLDYKLSAKRDRYGNKFRYRSAVNAGMADSEAGPFAYDVFLSVQPLLPAPPVDARDTINGGETPAGIPTEIVYGIFLHIVSCSAEDPEVYRKKCQLVQRAVGFDQKDSKIVAEQLTGFHDEMATLEYRIADLRRAPGQKEELQRIKDQRSSVMRAKIAALQQRLSPEGRRRLDAFIEGMKTKIKFVPDGSSTASIATRKAEGAL